MIPRKIDWKISKYHESRVMRTKFVLKTDKDHCKYASS